MDLEAHFIGANLPAVLILYVHVHNTLPPDELCRDCIDPRSDCSDVATDSALTGCGLGWSDTIPLELSSVSLEVVIWGWML